MTKDDILKAAKCCKNNSCPECPMIDDTNCHTVFVDYFLDHIKNEPAPSANGTSSEVSQSDMKKNLAHLDDSTKKAICQAFVQAQGAAAHILEIYERMSESEQRAFDLGEVYRELSGAMDELEDIKGGEKND